MGEMELVLGPSIVASYKRLSYKVWYALAEFIDNSTQAYFNNHIVLDAKYAEEHTQLTVDIEYHSEKDEILNDYIVISDNSIGMSESDLKEAFEIGVPPKDPTGRSRYGLGMKTAAFWLGDEWELETKKLNDKKAYTVKLNVDSISGGNLKIEIEDKKAELHEHYTKIKIIKLHRKFRTRTIEKIKSYIASMYRKDIEAKLLIVNWNKEEIEWFGYSTEDFIANVEGNPHRRDFEFEISGKKVSGWAGVLKNGSRNKGGFAILQSNRVIQSPPDGYKPESIFGFQEGGVNDLANQRIVGEIVLEGFEVSHTKDSIVWENNEEDELDEKIRMNIGDLRKTAIEHRVNPIDNGPSDVDFDFALDYVKNELGSPELIDTVHLKEIPEDNVIEESITQLKDSIINDNEPDIVNIKNLAVHLYIQDDMSSFAPYVVSDSTHDEHKVIIIVNRNHPYWNELEGKESIRNYLRHCIYDGVAEWKACFKVGTTNPTTIKFIKDNLLRVPFEIEKSKNFS